MATLYSDKQWQDVLIRGEDIFMNDGDQWLDLQRFSYEAARKIGGKCTLIANSILMNTKNFVSNNRKILDMKFPDQSLTANPKTREWIINEIEKTSAHARKPEIKNNPDIKTDNYKAEIEKAMEIAKTGDLYQAVHSLLANIDKAQSGREQFLWRLHVVEFCLRLNIPKFVIPTIEDLVKTVDDLHLKRWEDKDLMCRVYNAGYEGYLKLYGPQKAPEDKVNYFYDCLCLCNPGYFIKKK
jgi:hypothetical protein